MLSAVMAVQEFKERNNAGASWIPAGLLGLGQTYFGLNDWWYYNRSYHPRMCEQCDFFGSIGFFNGSDIRGTFPYLEIYDEDTIYVQVHPSCTCELKRVLGSVP